MGRLNDKIAVVTGGASGIGRTAALLFAAEGAAVMVADLTEDKGQQVAKEIADHGGRAAFIRTDVTSASDSKAMVDATVSKFGRLDVAFNNAGTSGDWHIAADVTEEEWDSTLTVNAKGVWLGMKYEIPAMLETGGGSIVNTASGAGETAPPGMAAYVASKHAVVGITRSVAQDYGPSGIRANAILPGMTMTPMLVLAGEGQDTELQTWADSVPLKRLGQPEDCAEAALFLASDAAGYITGIGLPVDGGLLI